MAASGFTPIQLYYSTTPSSVPLAGDLASGELAINIADGKLFFKDSGGTVQVLAQASGTGVSSISFGSTGLTPNTATTGVVTVAGTLATSNGGTGLTTFTGADRAIYSTSASALTAGTLPVAAGGTGQTSYTNGQLLIGNSTGNTLTKATLTAGSGITITNGNGSITIASTAGGGTVTSVAAGNGMSFSTITGAGTVTLGTPSDITSATTNSASTGTHTHALNNTGVVAGSYTNATITVDAKGRVTSASSGSSAGVTSFSAGTTGFTPSTATSGVVTLGGTLNIANGGTGATTASAARTALGAGTVSSVSAGSGMSFTTITGTGTVTLGTPSTITNSTTNNVSSGTHTHALTGELVETTTGSALYYGARAWVNFNSETATIRADMNVVSITDNGAGDFTVNFDTAMPDANYATIATVTNRGGGSTPAVNVSIGFGSSTSNNTDSTYTTSAVRVVLQNSNGTLADRPTVCVAVFR